MASEPKLRIAFIHPDLGIGGAERLVVDAALGLQTLGHSVDIYTSHHDRDHCFDETRDGTLRVHNVVSPFPRSFRGLFHILFAHARQLHLTKHLLFSSQQASSDVFFVDQLSTCIPLIRLWGKKRVIFYCHFPDKLLANGEFVEGKSRKKMGFLKSLYRFPMDWLEEVTTRQADIILANSKFSARVTQSYLPSIRQSPRVIYPGINIPAYEKAVDLSDPDIIRVSSERPTFLSLNRFEMKKNAVLAIQAFSLFQNESSGRKEVDGIRLVIAGGYDPRLEDNVMTLASLVDQAKARELTYDIVTPSQFQSNLPSIGGTTSDPSILFLLNFTTAQRSALLKAPSTLALLYTSANEHFGIGPVEGMICGLPVLACNSGGPTESVVDSPIEQKTGWLRAPEAKLWAEVLTEISSLTKEQRNVLATRSRNRARELFGMDSMAKKMEVVLQEAFEMGPIPSFNWQYLLYFVALVSYLFGYIFR
ncbi:glycosyltransferase family 4 protein [Serpula lacrymans var. lacrymans S7.3]|uniref:Alpha-1,3/1,6-mannosyltransferase ALG2 n=2 Tax=Serpula lacrymans var. lacrymans TaxID=341189 RepID=F8Q6Y2_SERL3|nr:glycosyltransferase family 4 protein [Serpula lacrymans var. lacrymans S7.9]EGN96370.1 glycosyltransferase family 4 protein [Serpula lacrymans var. lacrymans S7.3]EGO21907.1 glycosyltransferase family 4 protein [Serpula lacrymans var. lacrymans S7.9]